MCIFGSWTSDVKILKISGFLAGRFSKILRFFLIRFKSSSRNQIIEGHTTDVITDLAIRWLKKRGNNKKPFSCWFLTNGTLKTMDSSMRMISKYNNEWFSTPDNFFTDFNEFMPLLINISR